MNLLTSIRLWALIIGLTFALVQARAQSGHDHAAHNDHAEHEETNHSTEISKEQAQNILTAYLALKDALVQTNGEAASTAATNLLKVLGDSKEEMVEKIRFDATHIAETKDPGHQRDHFNTLSDNVYMVVKATEANESPIYRQYCPMALKSKGAFWLSAEKEVNNPYFGDKMLHCGMVKEELD